MAWWTWTKRRMWESVPAALRMSVGQLFGLLPTEWLLGHSFRAHRRSVEQMQWWSADRIRAYQVQRLRAICGLAYEKTAYYRQAFDAAGFRPDSIRHPEDITAAPTLTAQAVRNHLDAMCTMAPSSPYVDRISTGGTSGIPLEFYINADRSAVEYAYLTVSWRRAGYTLGTPLAVFRSRKMRPKRSGLYHDYDPILRHHYYSTFHMTDAHMQRYLDHIRTLKDCFLHVYPSTVTMLARFVQRTHITPPPNIRGIIAESEILYPQQREFVEAIFGCPCFACYGHTEKCVLAAECEHTSDYHVWPTYGYFELLDANGHAVTTPGERGEIVGTGFINTVTPFIRYRTGDTAEYVGDQCDACQRHHPIIRNIRGHRTQETLVAADGTHIAWTAINMHDDTFANVRQFQFHQTKPGEATLRVMVGADFSDDDRQRMLRNLNAKLEGRITLRIERCEQIPPSPMGKAVYVDQQIATEPGDDTTGSNNDTRSGEEPAAKHA